MSRHAADPTRHPGEATAADTIHGSKHQGTIDMNSNLSSEKTSRTSASGLGSKPSRASAESTGLSEADTQEGLSDLRRDVASLKDTLARLAAQAGGEAARTVRSMGQTVASQVGSAAGGVADA